MINSIKNNSKKSKCELCGKIVFQNRSLCLNTFIKNLFV